MRRAALMLLFLCLPAMASGDDEPDNSAAYLRAVDAVVYITAVDREWNFCTGSGVLIAENDGYGLILTAYHVVGNRMAGATRPKRDNDGAMITDEKRYGAIATEDRCLILRTDSARDLALIRWKYRHPDIKTVPIAARSATPGQSIFVIGSGARMPFRYSGGSIRRIVDDDYQYSNGQKIKARIAMTSCPIDPGDSGGPLLNRGGEIMGITSGTRTTLNQVHMAVDVTEIRAFVQPFLARTTPNPAAPGSPPAAGPPRPAMEKLADHALTAQEILQALPEDAQARRQALEMVIGSRRAALQEAISRTTGQFSALQAKMKAGAVSREQSDRELETLTRSNGENDRRLSELGKLSAYYKAHYDPSYSP